MEFQDCRVAYQPPFVNTPVLIPSIPVIVIPTTNTNGNPVVSQHQARIQSGLSSDAKINQDPYNTPPTPPVRLQQYSDSTYFNKKEDQDIQNINISNSRSPSSSGNECTSSRCANINKAVELVPSSK